jgi:hypothetical protein
MVMECPQSYRDPVIVVSQAETSQPSVDCFRAGLGRVVHGSYDLERIGIRNHNIVNELRGARWKVLIEHLLREFFE